MLLDPAGCLSGVGFGNNKLNIRHQRLMDTKLSCQSIRMNVSTYRWVMKQPGPQPAPTKQNNQTPIPNNHHIPHPFLGNAGYPGTLHGANISHLGKRKNMFDSKVICDFPAWRIIPGLGYVVTNHGNRKSPRREQCGTPSKWPSLYGFFQWGVFSILTVLTMPWDPILRGEAPGSLPYYLTSSTLPLVFPVEAPRSPGETHHVPDVVKR